MAFVNKPLISSLTQDIKDVKNLCSNINLKLKGVEFKSWLFPLKSCEDIEDIFRTNDKRENAYSLCLELLLDRLYLLLSLINAYFEIFTENRIEIPTSSKYISKPNNLSLGVTINNLWKHIIHVEEIMTNKKQIVAKEQKHHKYSVSTQTENLGISSCDSCGVFKQCIKNISATIISSIKYSNVEKARERLQNELFDMTQFGCMNQLVTSIITDVKKLVADNEYLECNTQRCNEETEKLIKSNGSNLSTIAFLEEKIKFLENDCDAEKKKCKELEEHLIKENTRSQSEIRSLNNQLSQLNNTNDALKSELERSIQENNSNEVKLKQCVEKLQKSENEVVEKILQVEKLQLENNNYKEQIKKHDMELVKCKKKNEQHNTNVQSLKVENEKLHTKVKCFTTDIRKLSEEIEKWKVRYTNLKGANMNLETENQSLMEKINSLKSNSDATLNKVDKIEKEMKETSSIFEEKLNIFESVLNIFENVVHKNIHNLRTKGNLDKNDGLKNNGLKNDPALQKDIEVKGDPLADMKNQMELNIKNIRTLEKQNSNLAKTIERLQKIQKLTLGS